MAKQLRPGMWISHRGRVGILTVPNDRAATGEVHYVDQDLGETSEIVQDVPLAELTQAAYMDIPACRRPDEKTAEAFGYL